MQIHYESGELLVTVVLVVLFIIIAIGFSYFIPTIAKEIGNRLRGKQDLRFLRIKTKKEK